MAFLSIPSGSGRKGTSPIQKNTVGYFCSAETNAQPESGIASIRK